MRPNAQLITIEDLMSLSKEPDGPFTEGEDGPLRPPGWMDPDAGEVPPWTMTMYANGRVSDHQGEKEELIRIAREAGVADDRIDIYDKAARGYVPLA